jgi:metallo-beta-lactamase class B
LFPRPILKFIAAALLAICWTQTANAEDSHDDHSQCTQDATWTNFQPPVQVYGNKLMVGARGLGVLIITSDTGHRLIEGGSPGQTQLTKATPRALGLQIRDIKWILVSHAHCDRFRYPPVKGSRAVAEGESLRLGNLILSAHATPHSGQHDLDLAVL